MEQFILQIGNVYLMDGESKKGFSCTSNLHKAIKFRNFDDASAAGQDIENWADVCFEAVPIVIN